MPEECQRSARGLPHVPTTTAPLDPVASPAPDRTVVPPVLPTDAPVRTNTEPLEPEEDTMPEARLLSPLEPVATTPELKTMCPLLPLVLDSPLEHKVEGRHQYSVSKSILHTDNTLVIFMEEGWSKLEGDSWVITHVCTVMSPLIDVGDEPALNTRAPEPACAAYPEATRTEPDPPPEVVPLLSTMPPLEPAVAALDDRMRSELTEARTRTIQRLRIMRKRVAKQELGSCLCCWYKMGGE